MAAAGKLFPQSCRQDFAHRHPIDHLSIPPYTWWMTFGTNPGGALMTKWVGFEGLSELWEQVDDELHWRINHPSITTDDPHWIMRWRLEWNGVTTADAIYRSRLRFSYHEAGTEWGFYDGIVAAWSFNLSNGGTFIFVEGSWTVTAPAEFANGGTTVRQRIRRATWPENPDFHPYRTRP